jgi:hypothetical protein
MTCESRPPTSELGARQSGNSAPGTAEILRAVTARARTCAARSARAASPKKPLRVLWEISLGAIQRTTHRVIARRACATWELLGTRPVPAAAKRYRDLAEEHGLSISDVIADLLRISVHHIDQLPAPALDQEELTLSQAS